MFMTAGARRWYKSFEVKRIVQMLLHRPDEQMAAQFERIIRRVKQSMNYRGSYSTRDILGSLVARWVHSGEWQRLEQVPAAERRIGESVRRFILDRLDQVRRRAEQPLMLDSFELPGEQELLDMVELAQLRAWIDVQIAKLEAGTPDPRIDIALTEPTQVGRVLRLQLQSLTQRQIAAELGISLGLVNKRIADGTSYLAVLQGIEQGISG